MGINQQDRVVACLQQTGVMLNRVMDWLLTPELDKAQLNFILSVILQFTDALNLRILEFYTANLERMNPLVEINHNSLGAIFRLFEAQPYMRQLWDTSALFQEIRVSDEIDSVVLFLVRGMVHNSGPQEISLQACAIIDRELRVKKQQLDEMEVVCEAA
jgi:hypothetical protein